MIKTKMMISMMTMNTSIMMMMPITLVSWQSTPPSHLGIDDDKNHNDDFNDDNDDNDDFNNDDDDDANKSCELAVEPSLTSATSERLPVAP